jgi:hypothetical protein
MSKLTNNFFYVIYRIPYCIGRINNFWLSIYVMRYRYVPLPVQYRTCCILATGTNIFVYLTNKNASPESRAYAVVPKGSVSLLVLMSPTTHVGIDLVKTDRKRSSQHISGTGTFANKCTINGTQSFFHAVKYNNIWSSKLRILIRTETKVDPQQ